MYGSINGEPVSKRLEPDFLIPGQLATEAKKWRRQWIANLEREIALTIRRHIPREQRGLGFNNKTRSGAVRADGFQDRIRFPGPLARVILCFQPGGSRSLRTRDVWRTRFASLIAFA